MGLLTTNEKLINHIYDVIVVGGGHAGIEAALSSARIGHSTLMLCGNFFRIGNMPCNPSIGGPAKGILVREIDALGGEMAKAADKTALQIKMLNISKGPAVRAMRVQSDKVAYKTYMQNVTSNTENLDIYISLVDKLIVEEGTIKGVTLEDGTNIYAKSVIITTGTYLSSCILVGKTSTPSGPDHENTNYGLSDSLRDLGFKNVYVVPEQELPNGNFPTVDYPNPEDIKAFDLALKLAKKQDADIVLATDPDADRMGIAAKNKEGEYVLLTGNQPGAILLDYLAKYKHTDKQRVVFNTIVTSNLAKAICERHGIELVQTLTGFKYIGDKIARALENNGKVFQIGYEESYGYVIKDFVRDKDSFQATLLLCEVASFYKEQGKTLYDVLFDIFEDYGYYIEGVHNISLVGAEGSAKINQIMTHFQQNPLKELAGKEIVTIEDYQDSIRLERGVKSKLTLPKSFVLKYIFEDGGWFVLRPSGTEPKLKIYVAIKGNTLDDANELIKRVKAEVLTIIDQI